MVRFQKRESLDHWAGETLTLWRAWPSGGIVGCAVCVGSVEVSRLKRHMAAAVCATPIVYADMSHLISTRLHRQASEGRIVPAERVPPKPARFSVARVVSSVA